MSQRFQLSGRYIFLLFSFVSLILFNSCTQKEAEKKDLSQSTPVVMLNDAKSWAIKGNADLKNGKYDDAIDDYNKAVSLDSHMADNYVSLAFIYWHVKKNFDQGLQFMNQALAMDPKNEKYYNYRADAYSDFEKYDLAILDYSKILELDPENKKVYSLRGLAYLMSKKYQEAVKDMSHAILDNQDVRQNYNNRCYALDKLGEYDKALVDCDNAIALGPEVADSYDTRSGVYLHKRDFDKSWADVNKVKDLGGQSSPDILDELKKESGRS